MSFIVMLEWVIVLHDHEVDHIHKITHARSKQLGLGASTRTDQQRRKCTNFDYLEIHINKIKSLQTTVPGRSTYVGCGSFEAYFALDATKS